MFNSMPEPYKEGFRSSFFTEDTMDMWRKTSHLSQLREFPEGWVFEVAEGDQEEFDYGIDYRECAVFKLFRRLGAERHMPYICLGDYAMFRAFGVGLSGPVQSGMVTTSATSGSAKGAILPGDGLPTG